MFKILDGREHFYQWDSDCQLIVDSNDIKEVHFCNRTDECSLVVEVYEKDGFKVANVPNILLQNDWRIKVYAYDGSRTRYDACYEVVKRSRPADYAYTETEVLTWHKIDEKVNKTIEEVEAAEATREANEISRDMAETMRINQEINRGIAESVRQDNEKARENTFNTLSNSLLDKIEEADGVIAETNEALETAKEINTRGEIAIQQAGVATDSANQATVNANQARRDAIAATNRANNSADTANFNAGRAGQAASAAELATYNANEATNKANTAATNADASAIGADEAANNANDVAANIQNRFANALKDTKSGDIVSLEASPIEHELKVKVRSNNLIPYPYNNYVVTNNEVTFTPQADGGIALNGTPTTYVMMRVYIGANLANSGTYTFSLQGEFTNAIADVALKQGATILGSFSTTSKTGNKVAINLDDYPGCDSWEFAIKRETNNTPMTGVVYPMINVGTEPAEYTPYVDASTASVIATGKNVIDKGIEDTNNWVWANIATAASSSGIYIFNNLGCGTYTISGKTNMADDSSVYMYLYYSTDNGATWQPKLGANGVQYVIAGKNTYPITFEKLEGELYCIWGNQKININKAKLQIEAGETATAIEPYSETITATPDAEGNVNGLTSIYPITTLSATGYGIAIDAEYNKDVNKVFGDIDKALDMILAIQEGGVKA